MKDLSNEDIVVMLMFEQLLCGKNDLSQESKYKSELLSHIAAGEKAVKKVAELEKDIERKKDLFVKKCFKCDEFEKEVELLKGFIKDLKESNEVLANAVTFEKKQAAAGQRAVEAMDKIIKCMDNNWLDGMVVIIQEYKEAL